jgi:hypothetical protein
MPFGSRLTPARAATAFAAACGAWLVACSADVDGYHLITDGIDHGTGGDASGGGNGIGGNRSASGGSTSVGGRTTADNAGGPNGGGPDASVMDNGGAGGIGGDGGTGGLGDGGNGGTGNGGTGGLGSGGIGSGGLGSGGTGTGGLGSGGIGSGGIGSGGLGSGGLGSGGTGSGGIGSGGVGSGGLGSGGIGSGGIGAGGIGSGGAGTGGTCGTWPCNPTTVPPIPALSGITAAAWEPSTQHYFFLKPAAKEVYEMNPATGAVTGPTALPGTKVAPGAFGASASSFYFVADSTLYRVSHTGAVTTSVAASATPPDTQWNGAYAGGWFVVGYPGGATQAVQDGTNVLNTPAKALTKVYGLVTDGNSFVFTMTSPSTPEVWVPRLTPGTFSVPAGHCVLPGSSYLNAPLSTYGQTVAWVLKGATTDRVDVATLSSTSCSINPNEITFAQASTGSGAVGLLDDRYVIVTSLVSPPTVTMIIEDMNAGPPSSPLSGSMGSGAPQAFVMGIGSPTHYAALVTGDRPVIVRF